MPCCTVAMFFVYYCVDMELDFIVGIIGLLLIPALCLFTGRHETSPLVKPKYFKIILLICIGLAIIALSTIGYVTKTKSSTLKNPYLFLLCPLYSLIVYRLLYIGFRKMYNRDPINYGKDAITSANSSDKLFQFLFLMLSILGPIAFVGICAP